MTHRRAGAMRLRDWIVLAVFLVYAIPFFWQLLTSLKPEAELMVLPPLLPTRLTGEHYRAVLEQSVMLRALGNSFGVGAITTVLALGLGLFGAYGLARYPVPGKGMLLLLIVGGTAFPQIATVSPLYLLMRALDLRDTWLALILANTSFALPLVIWLLMGFLQEVPAQLEEAAAVDGASRLRAFRWIVLPLLAPGLASAALLTFLFSWNEFLFAYTFTATEASRTVPVALALFPGVFEVPWGDIAAASMLASVPPLVLVIGLQRYLVRGLLSGALRE
ncbi:MAG TPA: carbohydrate ABC transporter permease [Methylomirabilota bacterium]|nr:carbohydrate ABC transporter permease [Methylomirabilota bacterium]